MAKTFSVSKIDFGDIDARSEILSRDPVKRNRFLEAFCIPKSVNINEVLNGDRFLIVGPKGSGKTALLRYLSNKLEKASESHSRFIVFRDDITEQDREKIVALSDVRLYEPETLETDESNETLDCLNAWQLFIHREIAHVVKSKNDLVGVTPEIAKYIELLNRFFGSFKTSGFKQLLQKINKGKIKLFGAGAGLEAEVEFFDKHGNVDVSELVRYCNSVARTFDFNALKNKARINIFFDEVNISFVSGKNFRRNAILVRDLVAACAKLNSIFAEDRIPIYVYTALRTEVVESVEGSVRELQKLVDDKAVHISWVTGIGSNENQPLIELLRRRIFANLKHYEAGPRRLEEVLLDDFFAKKIYGHRNSSFLIYETWGRPRDLVRMLSLASGHLGGSLIFTQASFESSLTEYSQACWEEKSDELNSKYSLSEIESIKRILTKFEPTFSRIQLEARISHKSANDSRVNQFVSGRNIEVVLEDLYKVGVLGNILKTREGGNRPAYLYTGHRNFTSDEIMCVHRSLWRELGLERAAKEILSSSSTKPPPARSRKRHQ